MKGEELFAAVRRDVATGEDFVDLGTCAYDRDAARRRSNEPPASWRDSNPLQRVARFRLQEVRS